MGLDMFFNGNYGNNINNKNNIFKNDIVDFEKGGLRSRNYYNFIPYSAIVRTNINDISNLNLNIIIPLIFGGILLMVFLGPLAIVIIGIIIVVLAMKSDLILHTYGLNIYLSSGAVYTFTAEKKEYVVSLLELLEEAINQQKNNISIDMSTGITTNIIKPTVTNSPGTNMSIGNIGNTYNEGRKGN